MRQCGDQCAQITEGCVPHRKRPQPDRSPLTRFQKTRDRAVPLFNPRRLHERGEMRRRLLRLGKTGCKDRRKLTDELGRCRINELCDAELIGKARRVYERDVCAAQRRLPHAVRKHRHFAA